MTSWFSLVPDSIHLFLALLFVSATSQDLYSSQILTSRGMLYIYIIFIFNFFFLACSFSISSAFMPHGLYFHWRSIVGQEEDHLPRAMLWRSPQQIPASRNIGLV